MLQNEKKTIILTVLIFFVLIGTVGTLTYFQYDKYSKLKKDIALKKSEKANAEHKKALIPGLQKELNKLSAQIEHYAQILPTKDEMAQDAFANTMQAFANNSKIQIIRADPIEQKGSNDKKKKNINEAFIKQSYHFELTGTFRNFLNFLHKVESWHRFLVVEEIGIKPYVDLGKQNSSSKSDITSAKLSKKSIELVVSTYIYTPKKANNKVNGKAQEKKKQA